MFSSSFEIDQLCGAGYLNDEIDDCNGIYDALSLNNRSMHNGMMTYEKRNCTKKRINKLKQFY